MPVYVYECDSCGRRFEVHQSFSDEALVKCLLTNEDAAEEHAPCGGKVHRVIHAPMVIFRGGGWPSKGTIVKPPYHSADIGDQPACAVDMSDHTPQPRPVYQPEYKARVHQAIGNRTRNYPTRRGSRKG